MNEFIHLHGHSTFSLRDAVGQPSEIIDAALAKGMDRIALTDHGNMNNLAPFYLSARRKNFRPIFGIEAYYIPSILEWKKLYEEYKISGGPVEDDTDTGEEEDEEVTRKIIYDPRKDYSHLVLLARNPEGLTDLFKLIYYSNVEGYYYRPRMDFEMLRKYGKNLAITSACMGGVLAKFILRNLKDPDLITAHVTKQIELFDEITGGYFYPEIQFNKYKEQEAVNRVLISICKSMGKKWVATNDFHYPSPELYVDRIILKETSMLGKRKEDHEVVIPKLEELEWQGWIKSRSEMESWAKEACPYLTSEDVKAGLDTATWLGTSVIEDIQIDTRPRLYFDFKNAFEQLVKMSRERLNETGLISDQRYVDRVVHELRIIKKIQVEKDVNMAEYFLMMKEIIDLAKKEMIIGLGRGSAAGSLICYLLGITQADPIKFDLLFERFIDPARAELPDIDTDFEDAQYAKDLIRTHFGAENVAYITNFGTLQLKSAIKDVSRVWKINFDEVNKVTKVIESETRPHIDIEDKSLFTWDFDVVKHWSPTFQAFLQKYPHIESNIANLMGQARHIGTHAAGLCIAKDIGHKMPVLRNRNKIQTGYADGVAAKNLSAMGFIKFDILGLNTLRIIHDACKEIAREKNIPAEEVLKWIHPDHVDLNDQKVWETVFHQGNFTAVFQFESDGMRKMCKTFKPRNLEELSAIVSLYRPGPLGSGMHNMYLKNKQNPSGIVYKHPILKEVLSPTWGMMIYQEQIMQVCNRLGKMDMGKTNQVRKHFVKRSKETIADVEGLKKKDDALFNEFKTGCLENGASEALAKELWDNFKEWSSYGFNRSHSICYSLVSYQTAWLRTHYPEDFILAVLNNDMSVKNLSEIRTQGFKILPIDFRKSQRTWFWDADEKGFRIPFKIIKGFGDAAMDDLKALKEAKTFADFIWRRKKDKTKVNKSQVESLINLGAFDCFDTNRKRLMKIWQEVQITKRMTEDSLKAIVDKYAVENDDFTPQELKRNEMEYFGLTISTNIFTQVQDPLLQEYVFDNWNPTKPFVFVEIQKIFKKQTKNGKIYLIVNCIDAKNNSQDIKVWSGTGHPKLQLGGALLVQLDKNDFGWSAKKIL